MTHKSRIETASKYSMLDQLEAEFDERFKNSEAKFNALPDTTQAETALPSNHADKNNALISNAGLHKRSNRSNSKCNPVFDGHASNLLANATEIQSSLLDQLHSTIRDINSILAVNKADLGSQTSSFKSEVPAKEVQPLESVTITLELPELNKFHSLDRPIANQLKLELSKAIASYLTNLAIAPSSLALENSLLSSARITNIK